MSQFRVGTRPGERKAEAISGATDAQLTVMFPDAKPKCLKHEIRNKHCTGCNRLTGISAAELECIAQNPIEAPLCDRCRQPVMDWRRHKAFHAAGGGTLQFDLARYDRLMAS